MMFQGPNLSTALYLNRHCQLLAVSVYQTNNINLDIFHDEPSKTGYDVKIHE